MIDYNNSEKRVSHVGNVLLHRNLIYMSSSITEVSQLYFILGFTAGAHFDA